jgi:ribonuclease HI
MGIGVAMVDSQGSVIARLSRACGDGTNNVAEQLAVLAALELARERSVDAPKIFTDSKLVVEQAAGRFSVSDALRARCRQIQTELRALRGSLTWIPRAKNDVADQLSKAALGKGSSPQTFRPRDLLLQAQTALPHLANDPPLLELAQLAVEVVATEPDRVRKALQKLRLGRSQHSNDPYDVARFYSRLKHGEQATQALELAISDRSPATQLRAMRMAGRGLLPLLTTWKLAMEQADTERWRHSK